MSKVQSFLGGTCRISLVQSEILSLNHTDLFNFTDILSVTFLSTAITSPILLSLPNCTFSYLPAVHVHICTCSCPLVALFHCNAVQGS